MRLIRFANIALLALGLAVLGSCGSSTGENAEAAPSGSNAQDAGAQMSRAMDTDPGMAPAFSLQKIRGGEVSLSGLQGKVVIVDFWATWCPPCLKGIPEFVELYETYNDQGLEVVGISVDRGGTKVVQKFLEENDVPYAVAMANMDVVDAYQVFTGIPTTYVIDRQGKIVEKVVGYRPKSFFENHVKNLL